MTDRRPGRFKRALNELFSPIDQQPTTPSVTPEATTPKATAPSQQPSNSSSAAPRTSDVGSYGVSITVGQGTGDGLGRKQAPTKLGEAEDLSDLNLVGVNGAVTGRHYLAVDVLPSDVGSGRTSYELLLNCRMLRRVAEELDNVPLAMRAADRERDLLADVTDLDLLLDVHQSLASFYIRHRYSSIGEEFADDLLGLAATAPLQSTEYTPHLKRAAVRKAAALRVIALTNLGFVEAARNAYGEMLDLGIDEESPTAIRARAMVEGAADKATGHATLLILSERIARREFDLEPKRSPVPIWRFGRSIESAMAGSGTGWEFYDDLSTRTDLERAITLRLAANAFDDSQAAASAAAIEQTRQVAWPWYQAELLYLA